MLTKINAIEISNIFALIATEVIVGNRSIGFINLEDSLRYKNILNTIKIAENKTKPNLTHRS